MTDENTAGSEDVRVDTPEYGCVTDLAKQQAATNTEKKAAAVAEKETSEPVQPVSEKE
jgi:hypothetical protein